MESDRRRFFVATSVMGMVGLAALAMPVDSATRHGPSAEAEVSAPEDLMREHGVLNRALLIYEEGLRRLHAREDVPPEVFQHTATLIRKFIEDYHERLEENFVFPAFEQRQTLVDLVKVLRKQHDAGRAVTDVILRTSVAEQFRKEEGRQALVQACEEFIRMYRPHEAREDTVLFPALHKITSDAQMKELGERFEQEEDRLFGEEGFEKAVDQIAALEKQLGIYDLGQFTPTVPRR